MRGLKSRIFDGLVRNEGIDIYAKLPIFAQNIAVSLVGWQLRVFRFSKHYEKCLEEFRELNQLSPAELKAWQDEELRELIQDAYENVPYYHDLFRSLRLRPEDIRTQEDLCKLPVLTKDVVKQDYTRFINQRIPRSQILAAYTSGTTANPFKLFFNRDVLGRIFAIPHGILEWFDISFRTVRKASFNVRKTTPLSQQRPPYWRTDVANNATHFSLWHLNGETFSYYLEHFNRVQPELVYGFPGVIFQFTDFIYRSGAITHKPKLVYSTAERLLPSFRERISSVWGCDVCDMCTCDYTYATATGPEGYNHIIAPYGIVRVLEHDLETPVGTGKVGNIVATTLINYVAPLINYVTNDMIALGDRTPDVTRPHPVASTILGRWDDMVVCPDGRILNVVADVLTKYAVGIHELQVIQEDLLDFVINYVPADDFEEQYLDKMAGLLEDLIREKLTINFVPYEHRIPRGSAGKLRTVISKVDPHKTP